MFTVKSLNPPFLNPPYQIRERFRTFLPVVVDVETGGFNPATDALLEVCMITVQIDNEGRLVPKDEYSVNIRPFEGSNIERVNIDFLGIDPYDEKRNLVEEGEAMEAGKTTQKYFDVCTVVEMNADDIREMGVSPNTVV